MGILGMILILISIAGFLVTFYSRNEDGKAVFRN